MSRRTQAAIISEWAREHGVLSKAESLIAALDENAQAPVGNWPARFEIYDAINTERARMEAKWGPNTCASPVFPLADKMAVLAEEAGEVATEVNNLREIPAACSPASARAERERLLAKLRAELVQVAAVAVAWLESL